MNLAIALKESVVCARERLTKRKILRNTFMSVGVLLALTRLMAAGSADGVFGFGQNSVRFTAFHLYHVRSTGLHTSRCPAQSLRAELITGSYTDASGVTHGFLRRPGGTFTTFDVPGSTSTTATSITPGGVITGDGTRHQWQCARLPS